MVKYFRKKTEKKIEEVSILWNTEVFKGMSRSQIMEFKKKYKKLILEQYKLNLKQEALNKKVARARKDVLAMEKESKGSLNTAIKVAVGGVFIATVMATSQMSAMEQQDVKVATAPMVSQVAIMEDNTAEDVTVESNVVSEVVIAEDTSVVNNKAEVPVKNNTIEDITVNSNVVSEVVIAEDTSVVDNKIETLVENNTIENITIDNNVTTETVSIEEISNDMVEIEDDFIIFDQALEMGIQMCENTQFDAIIMSKEVSVLDIIERANDPIVEKYFQMLFDTNVNNKTLEYNVSYIAPKGSISFNSREGGFFADIDSSKVEVRLDFNLQKAINDSIESGVDQATRDLLFGQYHKEVEDVMSKIYYDIEKELISSGAFLEEVKKDVATKLTDALTWEVNATIK